MDSRALTPVLEKMVAIGLVVLFVSGFAGALLGGAVPSYRSSVASEVADRALAAAADGIETAVPATNATTTIHVRLMLPETLADTTYRIVLQNRTVRLQHPNRKVSTTTRLSVPDRVTISNASVPAGEVVVSVRGDAENRTLTLEGA
ncbi:MAG: hypothetical protein ABEH64_09710 [Salinirussus sp.]